MNLVLIGVLAYIVATLMIGLLVSRRVQTEDDYLLAGRNLGFGFASLSLFATWFGAETCIGSPALVYEQGLAGTSSDPFGYALCLLLMGLVFAAPLWRRKFTTLADLFHHRYGRSAEWLGALVMIPTSVLWAAAQVRAFGQVLAVVSDFPITLAITIAAGATILYTATGGLLADVITDVVQGIALTIGLVILLVAVLMNISPDEFRIAFSPQRLTPTVSGHSLLKTMESWAAPVFGSLVAQEILTRAQASRTERIAKHATVTASILYTCVGLIPGVIAFMGFAMMPNLAEPEQIIPQMAERYLSPFFFVLFAGGLVSAILSTVDSSLLVSASLLEHNIILPLRPMMTEKMKVRAARLGVLLFGVVAYTIALYATGIYELVKEASTFGSAGLLVMMTFGLFTSFGGKVAAISSLLVGVVVSLAGNYVLEIEFSYLLSLLASLAVYVTVAGAERLYNKRTA
jgi:solute:Na+ symporter, SSS family